MHVSIYEIVDKLIYEHICTYLQDSCPFISDKNKTMCEMHDLLYMNIFYYPVNLEKLTLRLPLRLALFASA